MTGRALYDKYVDSLLAQRRTRWDSAAQEYRYVFPPEDDLPIAWPFLSGDERSVWVDLAAKVSPRPRRKR